MINKNSDVLPLVLYGAGNKAVEDINIIRNEGINPVCFCDTDISRQGTVYLDLPVISLEQAKKIYGDFNIFVTPLLKKQEIFDYLLKYEVKKERILNYSEWYQGCSLLEAHLAVDQVQGMFFCCPMNDEMNMDAPPIISWDNGEDVIESTISRWLDMRDRLILSIRNKEASECAHCSNIKYACWPYDKKLNTVHFCFKLPCQMSCIYCRNLIGITEENERFMDCFDFKRFVRSMEERKLLSEHTEFNIATGEITIYSRKDELLDSVEKYKLTLDTNAAIFDERIAKLASRSGSCLYISPDSGTRETYKRIKGVDAFDTVWSNIRKYVEHGVRLYIKYVLLDKNSNNSDITGFINETLKIRDGVLSIVISSDFYKQHPYTDEQIKQIAKMITLAKHNNIPVAINSSYTFNDIERINKAVESNL